MRKENFQPEELKARIRKIELFEVQGRINAQTAPFGKKEENSCMSSLRKCFH